MPILTSGSRLIRHKATSNGLLTNLVAYWGLDEAGGANNALDKHTNSLTLTQNNSPGSGTGLTYAGARTFNGSTQYFSRTSETLLQTGNIDWCFAVWVRFGTVPGAGKYPGIFSKDAAGQREFILIYNGDTQRFNVVLFNASNASAVALNDTVFGPAQANSWHFVTIRFVSSTGYAYMSINNGTESSALKGSDPSVKTSALAVGRYYDDGSAIRYHNDRIGPIAMWKNRTLDASARAALYNGGAGLTYAAFTA